MKSYGQHPINFVLLKILLYLLYCKSIICICLTFTCLILGKESLASSDYPAQSNEISLSYFLTVPQICTCLLVPLTVMSVCLSAYLFIHWAGQKFLRVFSITSYMCCAKLLQSCLTLCDPIACIPLGSSVHGILQAKILEWVAVLSSRGSSQPKD